MVSGMKYSMNQSNKPKIYPKIYLDPMALIVLLAILEKNIVRYVVLLVSMIPVIGGISIYIIPILYLFLFFLYITKYKVHVGISETLVLLFVILSIVGTYLFYPSNSEYLFESNNFWNTIYPSFRYFLVGLIFVSEKKVVNLAGKVSCLAILVEALFIFTYMIPRGLLISDEMSRAYQILPNVLLALNYSINEKKLTSWIFSILGIAYILAMGTRGPVVILSAFVFAKYLKTSSAKTWVRILIFLSISFLILLTIDSSIYVSVFSFLRNKFDEIGVSIRVFDFILNGDLISNTTGRDELFILAIQKIAERPLFGYGVYGEWPWIGWNIHNMYLELLIHFGILIGSIVLIWVFFLIFKAYFSTKNTYARDIILIWFCMVFIRGIFGGSYLQLNTFFLIGFCIGEIKRLKFVKSQKFGVSKLKQT